MKEAYVKQLKKPNSDPAEVRKEAQELIEDRSISVDLIEYAINSFLEAARAYYDDYDPQKLYYEIATKDEKLVLCFDVENLAHLLGLPNYRILQEAAIINKLLNERNQLAMINSQNWLKIFAQLLINKKPEIVNFDSDPANIGQKKLNWDKVAEKVFCFLNLGILSQNAGTPPVYYRENVSKGRKDGGIIISKSVITTEVSGQIRIQLRYEEHKYNGRTERVLVPISIIFIENPPRQKIIKMNGKEYKFEGIVTITQKLGGNYGRA